MVVATSGRAQRAAGTVAIIVVDRFGARSVDCQQLATVEVEPPAQQHELAKDGAKRSAIVASEIRDCVEVGLQAAQQPVDLDVAMDLALQTAARSNAVQVAVECRASGLRPAIAWPTGCIRFNWSKSRHIKVEPLHESVDEPDRIIRIDIVVDGLRQQEKLVARKSGEMVHARFYPLRAQGGNPFYVQFSHSLQ